MASLLAQVKTRYLAQIYSDDVWELDKLERSVCALEDTGADAVFSNNSFIDDLGAPIADEDVPSSQFVGDITLMTLDEHLHRFFFKGNSLHPVAMVIRADSYRDVGGVRPYLHSVGDMEFFLRLLLKKDVVFVKDRLQKIRIKSGGRQNESAPTIRTYLRVFGERMRFIEVLRSKPFLDRLERVFLPGLKGARIAPELRKWYLGHQFLKIGDPDYSLIAMQTIYEALDENLAEIEAYVIAVRGLTIGQYVEELASRTFASAADITSAQEIQRLNAIIVDLNAAVKHGNEVISASGSTGPASKLSSMYDLAVRDFDALDVRRA